MGLEPCRIRQGSLDKELRNKKIGNMGKYSFKINGHDYDVTVGSVEGGIAHVNVNGTDYQVELGSAAAGQPSPATLRHDSPAAAQQPFQTTARPAPQPSAPVHTQAAPAPAASGKGETVKAPLPGVILDVKVKVGDSVKAGQTVAVLEAMKMENEIEASVSGTVTAVSASKGDSVLEGAAIITIG